MPKVERAKFTGKIRKEVKERLPVKDTKKIILITETDSEIVVSSFAEAINRSDLSDKRISSFRVVLTCGGCRSVLFFSSLGFRLSSEIIPSRSGDTIPVDALHARTLVDWANTNNTHYIYQTRLRKWRPLCWLLFVFLATSSFLLLQAFGMRRQESTAKLEAKQILAQGVSQENQSKAVELMLRILTGDNDKYYFIYPAWYFVLIVVILLICAFISYRLRDTIGIGKGAKRIAHFRLLDRQINWIVYVLLAGLVCSAFFTDIFTSGPGFLPDDRPDRSSLVSG